MFEEKAKLDKERFAKEVNLHRELDQKMRKRDVKHEFKEEVAARCSNSSAKKDNLQNTTEEQAE